MTTKTTNLPAILAALVLALAAPAMARAEAPAGDVSKLALVGVAEQGGVAYASLFDYATGEHFLPSTKSPDGGYELVSVTDDENAVVRYNGQSIRLHLGLVGGGTLVATAPSSAAFAEQHIARPGSDEAATPTPPPGAKLPLVFQSGDLSRLHLTDEQKSTIYRLRGQFLAAIGAGYLSPATASTAAATPTATSSVSSPTSASSSDPTATWNSAQERSDDIFKMLYGYQAFNAYELAVQAQQLSPQAQH
jgi:hypothetical protein